MPYFEETVKIGPNRKKTVAFLQSQIGLKFLHGVDIIGRHVPVNFLSNP